MKKDSNSGKSLLILLAVFVVVTIIPFIFLKLASGTTVTNNKVQKYSNISFEQLEKKLSTSLCIPDKIRDEKELSAEVTMGQFIEVLGNSFALKIGPFENYDADPLDLYEAVENDERYSVNDNDKQIEFIRYRNGYSNLEHCTIVNWKSKDKSYGIVFDTVYNLDEVLQIFGLDSASLSGFGEEKRVDDINTENSEGDTVKVVVSDKYEFELPKTENKVDIFEDTDITVLKISDTIIMVVCNEDTEDFKGGEEYALSSGYQIRCLKDNKFSKGTSEYEDFEKIKESIAEIVNSFKFIL